MKKAFKITLIIFCLAMPLAAIAIKSPLSKYFISAYISHRFNAEVKMQKCDVSLSGRLLASGVEIKNKKGLNCTIKEADVRYNLAAVLKGEMALKYSLRSVKFIYSDSDIITGISRLFSIEPDYSLLFDAVDGQLFIKGDELVVKDLDARGENVSLFVNGTTTAEENISYKIKLTLSESITSRIPDVVRKIFFIEQKEYSIVELSISGNAKKPSINFSTPLFKLLIK